MLYLSTPSCEYSKELLKAQLMRLPYARKLVIVPSELAREEVERFALAEFGTIGGLEVLSLGALLSEFSGGIEVSKNAVIGAILSALSQFECLSFSSGFLSRISLAGALAKLFEVLEHSALEEPHIKELLIANVRDAAQAEELFEVFCLYRRILEKRGLPYSSMSHHNAERYINLLGITWNDVFVYGFYSLTPAQARLLAAVKKKTRGTFSALLELSSEAVEGNTTIEAIINHLRRTTLFSGFVGLFGDDEIVTSKRPAEPEITYSSEENTTHEALTAALYVRSLIEQGTQPEDIAVLYPQQGDFSDQCGFFLNRLGIDWQTSEPENVQKKPAWQFFSRMISATENNADPSLLADILMSPIINFPDGAPVSGSLLRMILSGARLRTCQNHLQVWREKVLEYSERLKKIHPDAKMIWENRIVFSPNSLENAVAGICELLGLLEAFTQSTPETASANLEKILACRLLIVHREVVSKLIDEVSASMESLYSFNGVTVVEAARIALESIRGECSQFGKERVVLASMLSGRQLLRKHIYIGSMSDVTFPFATPFLPFFPELASVPELKVIDRYEESVHLYYLLSRRSSRVVLSCSSFDGFSPLTQSFFYYFEKDSNSPLIAFSTAEKEQYLASYDKVNIASSKVFTSDWSSTLAAEIGKSPLLANGLLGCRAYSLRGYTPFCEYSGELSAGSCEEVSAIYRHLSDTQISVSDLEIYSKCPLWFFFKRVVGIAQPFNEQDTLLPPDKAGDIIHDLLSRFYTEFKQRYRGRSVGDVFSEARELLAEVYLEAIESAKAQGHPLYLISWLESFYSKEDGFSGMLGKFLEYEKDFPPPAFLEKSLSVVLPPQLGGFHLKGRVDRIDEDDGYWVIDYKTGKLPTYKSVIEGKALQLQAYSFMLRQKLGVDRSSFCYYGFEEIGRKLVRNNPASHAKMMSEAMENASQILPEIAQFMREGVFNRSFDDDFSRYCPYSGLCSSLCSCDGLLPSPDLRELEGVFRSHGEERGSNE